MKYLLVLFFAIIYEIDARCPNGTLSNFAGDKCYFISKNVMKFSLAETSCQDQNGNLASISNAFDNNALRGKNYGCISLSAVLVTESRKLRAGRIDAHSEQRYMQFCVCHK